MNKKTLPSQLNQDAIDILAGDMPEAAGAIYRECWFASTVEDSRTIKGPDGIFWRDIKVYVVVDFTTRMGDHGERFVKYGREIYDFLRRRTANELAI